MITQNLQDKAKAALRGKYTEYNPTSRNKKNIIDNLTLHLKQLQKKEQEASKLEGKKIKN